MVWPSISFQKMMKEAIFSDTIEPIIPLWWIIKDDYPLLTCAPSHPPNTDKTTTTTIATSTSTTISYGVLLLLLLKRR